MKILPDGTSGNKFYALTKDGELRWEFNTDGANHRSPAIGADGTIYFGSNDKKVCALNPNGTKKWEFLTGGSVGVSDPVIG